MRILGMGLSGLPVGVVLQQQAAGWPLWALLVLSSLLWPHLALLRSRTSADPYATEKHNLVVDSAIAGLWVSLMHFNLLPGALLLTLATVDKINTGIRGLWRRSMPWMLGAVLLGAVLGGFAFQPRTDMAVIIACMPILLIHTIVVSLHSYYLVRRVHRQNIRLDELSSTDPLTGLSNRRQWEEDAQRLLHDWHERGAPASLVVVDVDDFKRINDEYGHAAGDDVLRGLAAVLRSCAGDHPVGRNGGDEFAIVLPAGEAEAIRLADRVRCGVESLEVPGAPGLRCTVSLGVAAAGPEATTLRRWMIAADASLYEAKRGGRNRVGEGAAAAIRDAA
nr:sensor domain-containing diguanylate cyclase [Lysobacter sp. GX 14042]